MKRQRNLDESQVEDEELSKAKSRLASTSDTSEVKVFHESKNVTSSASESKQRESEHSKESDAESSGDGDEISGDEDDESQEGEDDDEEGTELDLVIDENGRVPAGVGENRFPPALDFSFRTLKILPDRCLNTLDTLVRDCAVAFTARNVGDAAYSAGETYFLPMSVAPRTALEVCAREVFEFHTRQLTAGVDYDPNTSGAEWWTLVLDHDEDVAFHWDRDYALEHSNGINIHPHLATVTYLSDSGGPTMVLDKVAPVTNDEESLDGPMATAWMSRPAVGKHISFDGRLLHGAPLEANVWKGDVQSRAQKSEDGSNQRVTFLVNVWLNHKPLGSDMFPENSLAQLSKAERVFKFTKDDDRVTAVRFDPERDDQDALAMKWHFKSKTKHEVIIQLPKKSLVEAECSNGSLMIDYRQGGCRLQS